jgi:hypothetical protein
MGENRSACRILEGKFEEKIKLRLTCQKIFTQIIEKDEG